jgi:hypothetical protein
MLTKDAFAENLNSKFKITFESGAVELELIEVVEAVFTPKQQQFSLFFRGPLEYFLQQATYRMEHESLGEIDLFIVPVGREADGFRYEAVFNYLT